MEKYADRIQTNEPFDMTIDTTGFSEIAKLKELNFSADLNDIQSVRRYKTKTGMVFKEESEYKKDMLKDRKNEPPLRSFVSRGSDGYIPKYIKKSTNLISERNRFQFRKYLVKATYMGKEAYGEDDYLITYNV